VRIVLDTSILVRATEKSHGPARDLLVNIVTREHTLVLSNEILFEVARVLRYPRLQALYGLSEGRVYEFVESLREVAEIVALSPMLALPSRDVNDIFVLQTAIMGEADVLCTRDDAFYSSPAAQLLERCRVSVLDDVSLLRRLHL
jgi:putative PIN family toxin of toxin-antitoxin system